MREQQTVTPEPEPAAIEAADGPVPAHPGRRKPAAARSSVEATMIRMASAQHGLVGRAQLIRAGISADMVDRRLKGGSLGRIYPCVYAVGAVRSPREAEMAAVLACGEGSAVSHWSAAKLRGILPAGRESGRVQVTVTRGQRGRMLGIRIYRTRTLRPDEVTKLDGIPVTTMVRTLHDLSRIASGRDLERVLAEALALKLTSREELLSAAPLYAHRPGASRIRSLIEAESGPARTRSEAEERFLSLVRRAQLPAPEANVEVAGLEVDFFWRSARLVIEVDGRAYHSSARTFEGDRRRDAVLVAAGARVMRVTWRQIVREPEALLVRLGRALGAGSLEADQTGHR